MFLTTLAVKLNSLFSGVYDTEPAEYIHELYRFCVQFFVADCCNG